MNANQKIWNAEALVNAIDRVAVDAATNVVTSYLEATNIPADVRQLTEDLKSTVAKLDEVLLIDTSNFATETDVSEMIETAMRNYSNDSELDEKISDALSDYVSNDDLDDKINGALSNYSDSDDTDEMVRRLIDARLDAYDHDDEIKAALGEVDFGSHVRTELENHEIMETVVDHGKRLDELEATTEHAGYLFKKIDDRLSGLAVQSIAELAQRIVELEAAFVRVTKNSDEIVNALNKRVSDAEQRAIVLTEALYSASVVLRSASR